MRFALSALSIFFIISSASAQQASQTSTGEPVYFVVDASGSMSGDNKKEAEDLLRGFSLPRGQLISVSYFGSKPNVKGADLCKEKINPPEPTQRRPEFLPNFPELGGSEDKTAIGNAVDSVLQSVKGKAKVILITDGFEECIADYDAIRKRYPEVKIEVRQVGDRPNADLYRLEPPLVSPPSNGPSAPPPSAPLINFAIQYSAHADNQPGSRDPSINWSLFNFIEKWLWLIGIIFVGGAAVSWGFDKQTKALERETTSGNLQQLRLAALVDGNEEARKKLRSAIDAANAERSRLKSAREVAGKQTGWKRLVGWLQDAAMFARAHKVGTAGMLILLALPLLSKGFGNEYFSIGRAQEAAWAALDSSFAEAFSLIAITIVFFAASQQRRLNEAVEKFGLATEQAEWAEAQLKTDREKAARADHALAESKFRDLSFTPPAPARNLAKARIEADRHAARSVFDAAISFAATDPPIGPTTTVEDIETEARTLEQFLSSARPGLFWNPLQKDPFAKFLDAVLAKRTELSKREDHDDWLKLASQFPSRESWPTIRRLAQKIKAAQKKEAQN